MQLIGLGPPNEARGQKWTSYDSLTHRDNIHNIKLTASQLSLASIAQWSVTMRAMREVPGSSLHQHHTFLCVYLFICLFVYLFVCLFVLFVLFVCLFCLFDTCVVLLKNCRRWFGAAYWKFGTHDRLWQYNIDMMLHRKAYMQQTTRSKEVTITQEHCFCDQLWHLFF